MISPWSLSPLSGAFQSLTLSRAINYNPYSHTVPWDLQTEIFIFFHAYSTVQHHGGFSTNLQKLSISSTAHGPFTANPSHRWSYWGQRFPGGVGCGCTQTSHQAGTTNAHICTQWIYHGPLPCLPASMCAFVVFFIRNSCTPPLADMCAVLHHYTEQERQHEFLSKTNAPRRPNLSPLLWQFITVSKLYTPHNTHRHIHKNTDRTEKTSKKGADQSIATCSVCLHVQYSVWLQPTRTWNTLCASGGKEKRNPLRSPASGIYGSKNSPILHINQEQLRQAKTENCFIECRQEVLSDSPTLKIITHIYILTPTCSQT